MPTQLLLEGPDIETVLTRVRDTHGSAARIVGAEKVRRGGFAGFFARERYEVRIELTDDDVPAAPAPTAAVAPGAVPAVLHAAIPAGGEPTSLLELSDAVSSVERAEQVGAVLSTSGARFAEVMASLGRGEDSPAAAPPVPAMPAAPHAAPAVPAAARHAAPAAVPAVPAVAAQDGVVAALLALGLPAHLVPLAVRGGAGDVHRALVTGLRRALPTAPKAPAGAGEVLVVVGPGATALEVATSLARGIGVEERSVLVIGPAGDRPLVPAARRLRTADEVSRARERMAALRRPSVVVVDAAFTTGAADRARAMLAALGARACWAVVDATRKPDDVGDWLSRLGRVDALVVEDTGSTRDPAAVLALGRPVALLDRRRATPAVWAGLLCARLAGEDDE